MPGAGKRCAVGHRSSATARTPSGPAPGEPGESRRSASQTFSDTPLGQHMPQMRTKTSVFSRLERKWISALTGPMASRSSASGAEVKTMTSRFSATITEKPSGLSVSPMVRASLTAFCSLGTYL